MTRRAVRGVGVIALLVAVQSPFTVRAGELPAADVVAAAKEGVRTYVHGIPADRVNQFGFSDQGEVDASTLGQGFRIFTVHPDVLLETAAGGDISSLAVPTTLWQFLITTGGKTASLLTVDLMEGSWVPVSLGSAGLAGQLGQLMKTWPASDGYDYRIIRIYQAQSDFVEISQGEVIIGILPLTSARVALGLTDDFDPGNLRDGKSIVNDIRPVVQKSLKDDGK